MFNNFKIFKKEVTNTKLYCLVVEGREYTSLSVQLANSLEEAFFLAKREFISKNPHLEEKLIGAKIGLFEIKEIPELFFGTKWRNMSNSSVGRNSTLSEMGIKKAEKQELTKTENVEKDKMIEKNKFMKFLIDNSNTEILEKNKNLFTKNEIKYVEDKIADKETLKQKTKNNDSM